MDAEAKSVAELSAAVMTLTQALMQAQAENRQLKAALERVYRDTQINTPSLQRYGR